MHLNRPAEAVNAANCIAIAVVSVGLIGFTANVVQYGMDQLHDSPGEDRTLFIHWYVWTYHAALLIPKACLIFEALFSFYC